MLDKETMWRFCYVFSWALEALMWETKELWSEQEEIRKWPKMIRKGKQVPGDSRIVQDRFVRVFQDFFLSFTDNHNEYFKIQEDVKKKIFSSWHDWTNPG